MARLRRSAAASILVGLTACAAPPPAEPARPVLVSPPWDWIHWDAPAPTPVVATVPASTRAAPWTAPGPPSPPTWTPRLLPPAPRAPSVSTGTSVSGGAVENAGSKTMGWSGAFRRCFAAAVKDDASFEGVVRLQVIVGPTGDVTDVQSAHAGPMETSPALDAFLECLAAKPFADTFTLSSGDHAVVVLALRFTQETVGPDAPTKGPTS